MLIKALRTVTYVCVAVFLFSSCTNSEPKGKNNNVDANGNSAQQSFQPVAAESTESLENSLRTDSLNTEKRLKLAAAYYTNKEFEKAISHYLFINRRDKSNLAALFNLGNIYYDTQQNEQAIVYYEKFLELDKNNSNVRCDLATCYMNLKKTEKAIGILRENIKINNNHPQSHYNLSVMLKQTGKLAESETELTIYKNMTAGQQGQ